MNSDQQLLSELDGRGSDKERMAIGELKARHGKELPLVLFEHYKNSNNWRIRSACVYYSIGFARTSSAAIDLAALALLDKSKIVRYRAAMLFACSLDTRSLPFLKSALNKLSGESREDVKAAIDAIVHQNQNFFLDRKHDGMITLNVLVEST